MTEEQEKIINEYNLTLMAKFGPDFVRGYWKQSYKALFSLIPEENRTEEINIMLNELNKLKSHD